MRLEAAGCGFLETFGYTEYSGLNRNQCVVMRQVSQFLADNVPIKTIK